MADVAEVVVRATPEGMDEVNEDLQQMEEGLAESTDEMDGSAEAMAALSQKFKGAMAATVASLAVGVGGILSQVPVMQELADAIGSVIDSVALKLDEKLRPTVSDVTDEVYDFSDAIAEADSNLDILLEGIETTFQIEDIIIEAGVDFVVDVSQDDIDPIKPLSKVLATWFEINTDNVDFPVDTLAKGIELWISDSWDNAKQKLSPTSWVKNLVKRFNSGVRDGKQAGRNFVQAIINGIQERVSDLRGYVNGIEIGGGFTIGEVVDITGSLGSGLSAGSDGGAADFIGSVASNSQKIFLDGSQVDDNQGRYRKDALARRGG